MRKSNVYFITSLSILILGAIVFLPFGQIEFLTYDDEIHLKNNLFFNPMSWHSFLNIWKDAYAGLYIPVAYSIWGFTSLSAQILFGNNWDQAVVIWHFILLNFFVHLFNTYLVSLILKRILKSVSNEAILFGSLIFLFHPIQVESVVWISAFRDSICVTFSLLTIIAYLKKKYFWTYVGTLLAILSKPSAVTLPLVLMTFYFWESNWRILNLRKKQLLYLATLFAISIPFMFIAKNLQPNNSLQDIVAWYYRPLIAADALGFYLKKLIWPFELGPDYGRKPISVLSQLPTIELLFSTLFIAMTAWLISTKKYFKSDGILAMLLILIPLITVLGFIPFQFQKFSTVADRYLYFSMLGVAIGSTLAFNRFYKARFVAAPIVLLFTYLSFSQAKHWRTGEAFTTYTIKINPNSDIGHTNYGYVLAKRNQNSEALFHFQRALEINPSNFAAASNIGTLLIDLGETQKALDHYEKELDKYPKNVEARIGYGILLSQLKRDQESSSHLKIATEIDSKNAFGLFHYSMVLWKLGLSDLSLLNLRNAIALEPNNESYKKALKQVESYKSGNK